MAARTASELFRRRGRVIDRRRLLKPMASGELLDLAVQMYQRTAGAVLRASMLPCLLCLAALIFITGYTIPSFVLTRQPESIGGQVGEVVVTMLVTLCVALPLFTLGLSYAMGVTVRLAANLILGEDRKQESLVEDGAAAVMAVAKISSLVILRAFIVLLVSAALFAASAFLESIGDEVISLMTSSAAVIAVVLGFLAVPWVLNSFALAPVITILEGKTGKEALARSRTLMRGARYQTSSSEPILGAWLLIVILMLLIAFAYGTVIDLVGVHNWLAGLASGGLLGPVVTGLVDVLGIYLAIWLLAPVWGTVTTLLYFDRRVRLEAYDIHLLADDLARSNRRTVPLS